MKRAYMDHAAATPVRPEVLEAMLPFFVERFGNPSAVYDLGAEIKEVMEEQRAKVARLIGARSDEIIFTSSGAEANNLAIKGVALANFLKKGRHLIVSGIEHHSVLNAARYLEKFLDFEVTFLPVDKYGQVEPERLKKSLTPATVLVSIGHGSNEIGTVQDIPELAAVCRAAGVLFHTDAVATVGNMPVDVKEMGVDLLTLSGPALGAPKGIGALYFRQQTASGAPDSRRHSGKRPARRHRERARHRGVGNGGGVGPRRSWREGRLPDKIEGPVVAGIQERIPYVIYTGHPEKSLPGHASFCFEGIEGEALIFMLSRQGIYANTGSACASKALKVSPVLCAIGIKPEVAQGSLVFTLNRDNREDEMDYVLAQLPPAVERLRSFSPVWRKKMAEAAGGQ